MIETILNQCLSVQNFMLPELLILVAVSFSCYARGNKCLVICFVFFVHHNLSSSFNSYVVGMYGKVFILCILYPVTWGFDLIIGIVLVHLKLQKF